MTADRASISRRLDPVTRDKWGPIIPPTSIDWIGDALVTAVLDALGMDGP